MCMAIDLATHSVGIAIDKFVVRPAPRLQTPTVAGRNVPDDVDLGIAVLCLLKLVS